MLSNNDNRGIWSSKLGFVLAASGSAVGLGNIWGFPTQVASNGGAAFLLIYLLCCFLVGFPLMVAELAIGRHTKRNPVGSLKVLGQAKKIFLLVGFWCVCCGVMILSYYNVVAGWVLSYLFEEIAYFSTNSGLAIFFSDTTNGLKNALFAVVFIIATVSIVIGGVHKGIERAAKLIMPLFICIMLILIAYVFTLKGSMLGISKYLIPDFSSINSSLVFSALGQAFFSLSLGMGVLITYGSYMANDQNIPKAAAYVTLTDFSIAFLAGLLIIPTMYIAQENGIKILDQTGGLLNEDTLVFSVLPELFHSLGGFVGFTFSILFFALLSLAALTSTISLFEVPVSYLIDEHSVGRKKAVLIIAGLVGVISVTISFNVNLIGLFATIFNNIGLPLGGLMISLFLGYFWRTENAMLELRKGFDAIDQGQFVLLWPIFIRYICPLLISLILIVTIYLTLW